MALYAIGDLHLSQNTNKPMDVFGGAWSNYMDKLNAGMACIGQEDTTVLLGDLTWALTLEEAVMDFQWISNIPGRKIIIKGNHDYWWTTAAKFNAFCKEKGFPDICVMNNNCYFYDDIALCGTRGWFFEEERSAEHDRKILSRELLRLETSLKAAEDRQKLVFLHYPPLYKGYRCDEILDLLHKYDVHTCFYGHLHGPSIPLAAEGIWDGIDFKLLSADKLLFEPFPVIK